MAERCICGHELSMHFAISGKCMKVIARDTRGDNHQRCTCREYRSERAPKPSPQSAGSRTMADARFVSAPPGAHICGGSWEKMSAVGQFGPRNRQGG